MSLQTNTVYEPTQSRRLLLVDDEQNISRSLVRLFRQDGYEIFTASGGAEGLEMLAQHDIGVIVSDQRMPEMSGTEFLSQVSQLYPETIRIVLSGYTELKSVTEAINEGKIYKFLTKPWDDRLLRQNIRDAFVQYEMQSENKRLAAELAVANEELKKLNHKLSNNLKSESRISQINLRSLQVAQDILHHLPVGILGIDDDDAIVFANKMSHQLFSDMTEYLMGNDVNIIMPFFNRDLQDKTLSLNSYQIKKEGRYIDVNIRVFYHNILNESRALIAVIYPLNGV